jgi:hypothetical protein
MSDIVRGRNWTWATLLYLVLFEPVFALLPTVAEEARQIADTQFELHRNVRGERVDFTTGLTDRHSRNGDSINQEAVNVCWRAKSSENGSSRSSIDPRMPGKGWVGNTSFHYHIPRHRYVTAY